MSAVPVLDPGQSPAEAPPLPPGSMSLSGRHRRAIDAERLRLANLQVVRSPPGVLFAAGFIGHMMAPHVGPVRAWGWAAAVAGLWLLRAGVSGVLLARPPAPPHVPAWIRFVTLSTAASGLVAGSAAVIFFGAPALQWALMTMVLCAWAAAGIAVSGAVPAAFAGLATAFLLPLAVAWGVSSMPLRWPVAGLLLFFLFYLLVFARDASALLARALQVGFDNEELAQRLRGREVEAQAARARAETANRAKSRFLAAASHDLRQPLHSLALLLDHAVHIAHDPPLHATLRQAARSAEALGRLLDDLLDLSRLEAGGPATDCQPVSLRVLCRRLASEFRPLAEDKGLTLRCASPDHWVLSDPALLERVLRNLLDNAVKYTPAGSVALQVDEADAAGRRLRVSVVDTGIGIEPADRERIFEEYYQVRSPHRRREPGSGLGLAIVRRLCDRLGHGLAVESVPGQGSRFSVTLPRVAGPAAVPPGEDRADGPDLDALRDRVVVVLDDDADVGEAMRRLLQGWGCRPVIAEDASEAIGQLEAACQAPDAVLADWRLAGAETGLEAIGRLVRRFGPVPAAIVTGEIDVAALRDGRHPAVAVMQKPLRGQDLAAWLLQGIAAR